MFVGVLLTPELLIGAKGAYRFPLYWQSEPFAITGVVEKELPQRYKEFIELLSRFTPMSCKELIDMKNDEEGLLQFLSKS